MWLSRHNLSQATRVAVAADLLCEEALVMRAVFGLLLVMLGLAMAVVWMPEHDSERQLAVVTDIATQGLARRGDAGGIAVAGHSHTTRR